MANTKIVILGAGYGGVHAAKKLNKKFKNVDDVDITIIDKNPFHTLMTDLHEIAGNRVEKETVMVDLKKIFAGKKVEVVVDGIKNIDFKSQTLISEENSYSYDYLIIGTGAEPAFFGIPGADEFSYTIWSLDQALAIKKQVIKMFDKARFVKDESLRRKMLTFTVAGAGFTGVEVVGELAEWKHKLCRDYNIDKNEVSLIIIEAMDNILPILNEKLQKKASNKMEKMGIQIKTGIPISEVKEDCVCLKDGNVIPTNTLIWTAGVQGSSCAASMGLKCSRRARVQTNDFMQSLDHNNVYLIGDNATNAEEGKRDYPQIVEAALQTAETAAHNIAADIEKKEKIPFKPNFHGFMVSVGSKYAVAHVGGMQLSGFFAMAVKHMVNLHYLFGVGGLALIWSYIIHEFFNIREKRSMLGGHFSRKTPTFWLFPLRLFLGFKWFMEGIEKLPRILEEPAKIFLIPAPVVDASSGASQAVEAAADAASSASPAAGAAAEAASQWGEALPVPEFIDIIVKWSMDIFFYTNDGGFTVLAQLFQGCMVLGEIAIGLCLLAGLFTPIASIVSIGMGVMIWASGMAPFEMLWYVIAAIALIGGTGRALGLDYYVMPVLKNWWKKTGFAKKTYLYID